MEIGATRAVAATARHLAATPSTTGLPAAEEAKLRKAAQDFESILLRDVIKTMRKSAGGGKGLLTGVGTTLYQDMMDDELAKALARRGGLGLADVLVRSLHRTAPHTKNPSSSAPAVPMSSSSTTPTAEESPR
jgi:flagellar protein FlgJ